MDATVTFSKEFKQKANKPLGNVEKRELRIQRLVDADKDGRLAKAKTRYDVGALAGFTEAQRTSGYLWAYHLIKDGILKEHIMEYTKDGHAEYEYHVIDPSSKPRKDSRAVKHINDSTLKKVAEEVCNNVIAPVEEAKVLATNKVTIRTAKIEIVIEGELSAETLTSLAAALNKEA